MSIVVAFVIAQLIGFGIALLISLTILGIYIAVRKQ